MRVESARTTPYAARPGGPWARSRKVGWYVGWVETGDDVWFFAINVDIRTPEDARFRKEALNAAMRETGSLSDVVGIKASTEL